MSDSTEKALPFWTRWRILGAATAGIAILGAGVLLAAGSSVLPTASNQGFAPVQPISFSHRLHAGQYRIDCGYCHVAAERSRHATVPALSVCLNCHSVVKTDSPRIRMLRRAYDERRPIEWVRVHELPDYVYFSHKRHVAVGLPCEHCHGEVRHLERMVQFSPLTMGWCIECHRGQTAPRSLIQRFHPGPRPGPGISPEDREAHPVAPTNCSTCHS
jgi:hypothetical protein